MTSDENMIRSLLHNDRKVYYLVGTCGTGDYVTQFASNVTVSTKYKYLFFGEETETIKLSGYTKIYMGKYGSQLYFKGYWEANLDDFVSKIDLAED